MGFKVGRTFTLEFAGTDLDGAEVKMRSASVGDLIEILEAEGTGGARREAEFFAKHFVSWNLETEDGTPVPGTAEGLFTLEEPVKDLIVAEWIKATRGITAPLDHRSSDGQPSGAPEQIKMESL